MTRIMAIEGRRVTVYDSFTHAARETGFTEKVIARLIETGETRFGFCFDISLDSDDKER